MKASIIIPSFNAKERLRYNLVALKHQDFPHDDFEVIVVDNGSSDDTMEMLQQFDPNYPLKTVRVEKNRGIAHGRNRAIAEATGDILIFHDSDMIAPGDFVRQHVEAHQTENAVICGLIWKRIFTFHYRNLPPFQKKAFDKLRDQYTLEEGFEEQEIYPLLTEEQIIDGSYLKFSFDLDMDFIRWLQEVVQKFGPELKGYHLPWRFFITNNASAPRRRVLEVGTFDENIVRYGFEDYDLGIRLFKSGSRFKLKQEIVSVHQEHPTNIKYEDLQVNMNYICQKYHSIYFIDMLLVCLAEFTSVDYNSLNDIVKEVDQMAFLGFFDDLLQIFIELLQTVRKRRFQSDEAGKFTIWPDTEINLNKIQRQAGVLRDKFGFPHFTDALLHLIKDVFQCELKV